MLRNLSIDLFVISYITGFFKFIPKYIIFLIILTYFLDAFALYFSSIGQAMIKNNANLNKFIIEYLKYTKPLKSTSPFLFFLDRFIVGCIFIIILIRYYYLHGMCK